MSAEMERVDSATTEDSPFASSLTTPVDEEVQIHFYNKGHRMGIEGRLSGLCNENKNGEFGSAVYAGLLENMEGGEISVSRQEFSRELEAKLSTLDPTFPTNTLTPLSLPSDSTPGKELISPVLFSGASTMVMPDMCQNSTQTPITFQSQGSTAESTPDLRPRSDSIYSLPNEQIIVETESEYYPSSEAATNETTSVIESLSFSCSTPSAIQQTTETANPATCDLYLTLKPSNDSLKLKASLQLLQAIIDIDPVLDASNDSLRPTPRNDLSSFSFGDENDGSSAFLLLGTQDINLTSLYPSSLTNALLLILRVLFFLPWCVAVGGTIVMYPQHLEHVAFGFGYIKSTKGIRRFAHWADTGIQHVWIFFGFLASIWWIYPILGWMLIGGVVAQTANAWQDFEVDRSIPLGEDDRQTIYLVAKQYGLPDELVGISKTGQGFMILKLDRPHVELEDLIDDEQ